jgi:acid phosphatase
MRVNRRKVLLSIASAAAANAFPSGNSSADEAGFNFLVVGDWGRGGTNHQREVAEQMGRAGETLGSRCVISVGDNFYEEGVQSAGDPQWQSSFENIYTARSLQVPWFAVLGNHDYLGSPQAQIDYSKGSPRWRMPSRYYKVAGVDLGVPALDVYFIDTSPLVHEYRQPVHGKIAENIAGQDVAAQLLWLDRELGESHAPCKLVVGHHTIYSGGSAHGNTPETIKLLDPILRKHAVKAYINGHDHDLQHIRRGGIDYIGCGAGSETRSVHAIEGTLFCQARSGFAAMNLKHDSLLLEFRDFTGTRLYAAEIPVGV